MNEMNGKLQLEEGKNQLVKVEGFLPAIISQLLPVPTLPNIWISHIPIGYPIYKLLFLFENASTTGESHL